MRERMEEAFDAVLAWLLNSAASSSNGGKKSFKAADCEVLLERGPELVGDAAPPVKVCDRADKDGLRSPSIPPSCFSLGPLLATGIRDLGDTLRSALEFAVDAAVRGVRASGSVLSGDF